MKPILCTFLPAAWTMFIFWCFGADLTHPGRDLGMAVYSATMAGLVGWIIYRYSRNGKENES
jgi:hypothetical protein